MFVSRSDDRAAVMSVQTGFRSAQRLPGAVVSVDIHADAPTPVRCKGRVVGLATELVWVQLVLGPGQANREVGIEVVVDELEGHSIVRCCSEAREDVRGDCVELVVYRRLIRPNVAEEDGQLIALVASAIRRIVVEIVETAKVRAYFQPLYLAPGARMKVNRASRCVVTIERRGRTPTTSTLLYA